MIHKGDSARESGELDRLAFQAVKLDSQAERKFNRVDFSSPVVLQANEQYHFASKYSSGSSGWTGSLSGGSDGKSFTAGGVSFTLEQSKDPRSNGTSTGSGRLPAFYFVKLSDIAEAQSRISSHAAVSTSGLIEDRFNLPSMVVGKSSAKMVQAVRTQFANVVASGASMGSARALVALVQGAAQRLQVGVSGSKQVSAGNRASDRAMLLAGLRMCKMVLPLSAPSKDRTKPFTDFAVDLKEEMSKGKGKDNDASRGVPEAELPPWCTEDPQDVAMLLWTLDKALTDAMGLGHSTIAKEAAACSRALMPLLLPSPASQLRKVHEVLATVLQQCEEGTFDQGSQNVVVLTALLNSVSTGPDVVSMFAGYLPPNEAFSTMFPRVSAD